MRINRNDIDQIRTKKSNIAEQKKPNRGFMSCDQVNFDTRSSRRCLSQNLEARKHGRYRKIRGKGRRGNPRRRGGVVWERRGAKGAYSARGRGRAMPWRSGERRDDGEAAARGRREKRMGRRMLLRRAIFRARGFARFGLSSETLVATRVRLSVRDLG